MKKIVRNTSTPESREFWAAIETSAQEVQHWPEWKRAGINVAQFRQKPLDAPVLVDPTKIDQRK